MASCGEIDHSASLLAPGRKGGGGGDSCPSPALPVPECAICLQSCVHPVRLPCRHVFCFLCVKGASWQSKRCALCRQEVPEDFLERPTLLSPEELKASASGRGSGEYAWYYEGRNGWWQYDERTSRELEEAFSKGKKTTEMLIAGFLYVADLENMVQYRRNEHGRRRRMKRDIVDIPKKGVAGLRLDTDTVVQAAVRESSADGADTSGLPGTSAAPVAAPGRTATARGGPPTSPSGHSDDDALSLDGAFAQLQISRGVAGEGEEEDEDEEGTSPSRLSSAPDTSVDELGSSSEDEDDEQPDEEIVAQYRQRPQRPRPGPTDRSPPGGAPGGGAVGSRRPDGQCTVTEV
ncbi:E3 ubiquitin-protein ligase rnf146 [Denticeps clupeoides]|uniref:E3 ubiquitin-protein ligase n=1 Tax=Denticeps clupeoides TaxID=299321 RepID=A0AAY4E7R1_9TELE|nr:E3 ubiquitin-protein ligase RNF146 [Denticeps clupeoides]XP_028834604.1 E3 ubiquitin-protein ligase RNF146 [Denticeps clupeoides]XP_028834605.1 E3 ubiquitin-protein ligase RNF146 [Denticeps clupeoides]XP_028834606.1 E3 ubiquitin-protein ligase RNF146 [Denticeps clupeoides]XP_028834607.1 E3 ubiquitin-protein ligase RNF146 [Denticeps clupeoides]XP_028834608.1 E3 ubiquitin-protein ligase RNF146 [Denticeps clupeoides]